MGMPLSKMTLEEFLAWESDQPERHEFHRGETFAMVGGTRGHHRVIANLVRHLGNHLDDGPCQVFSEAMKVQVGHEAILYPDVLVTCDKHYKADELAVTAPTLVVEVLSPSTEAYDRGKKFALYRKLPSLREYVLIDVEARQAEIFRPQQDGSWNFVETSGDGVLALDSIGCELPLEWVFKGMESEAT